ncbi:unnamed protein product [uncultured virus]|nr:unnamed protein product [uncultured virus]
MDCLSIDEYKNLLEEVDYVITPDELKALTLLLFDKRIIHDTSTLN